MKYALFLLIVVAFSHTGMSQSPLNVPVPFINESKPLAEFLSNLEKDHPVRFFFMEEWLNGYEVDSRFNNYTLDKVLHELFENSDVRFIVLYDYAVVFIKDVALAKRHQQLLETAMVQKKNIRQLVIGTRGPKTPPRVTLSGHVKGETGGLLAGVIISADNLNVRTTTDALGHYSINLPPGEHVISYQFLNFSDKVVDLRIYENGTLPVEMEQAPIVLDEVEVSDQALLSVRTGQTVLKMKDLKRAPAFLGEVDVIKSIQTQAGVTTVGEAASGFNVRGGSVDQNLVLYDGIPVFNTSHALGFFTAFNPDAVGQVVFHRGGIPALYGGRASSVLSITSREGNKDKWEGSGGIGIISSYLSVGGPIKKDTTSIMLSARTSYSDWMLDAVKSNYQTLSNSSVSFYDASFKVNHKLGSKTKLVLSAYTSNDQFTLANDTLYGWRNIASSLRVDHVLTDKLFSSVTLGFGKYTYQLKEDDAANAFTLGYGITYPSFNLDFNYNGRHELAFGLHNTFYSFNPGHLKPARQSSVIRHIDLPEERSLETALYFSDGFYWTEDAYVEVGLRYSIFNRIGPGQIYTYQPGSPRENRYITDSVSYASYEIMKTYTGPEPRISMRYTLTQHSSLKLGYNRMYQYIHLITNTAAVTPVDIWQSGNTFFKPQVADQISLGYYRNLKENAYEVFVESYYKQVQNTLDFKDGGELLLNRNLETALLPGKGRSYGVEVSATKVTGRLLGSLNYTFSRSLRRVNGTAESEKVNGGALFPANADQPHVVNVSWRYNISRRYFFSGNFTYHTGRPMSLPAAAYQVDGVPVSDFPDRNKYRLPDYHRLDIAFILEGNHKRRKFWDGTWSLSFYNLYARKNAYSVFFRTDSYGILRPYKLSVIGTIIPSLNYSFKI